MVFTNKSLTLSFYDTLHVLYWLNPLIFLGFMSIGWKLIIKPYLSPLDFSDSVLKPADIVRLLGLQYCWSVTYSTDWIVASFLSFNFFTFCFFLFLLAERIWVNFTINYNNKFTVKTFLTNFFTNNDITATFLFGVWLQ